MPYQDSPGWERQWKQFSWEWDFHVSTVSEGHRVVNDQDKASAKTKGAKLTFGEVLDCGVSRMLHNLGAANKSSFHDLGMGPGKMLIQTYLQYNNLTRCMGVELAKGRYDLGERNLRTLLKTGWRGRSFLGIEFKKGEFFKIVEDVPDKAPDKGWAIGDSVVAYFPLFKKDKMMIKDYHGKIVAIKKHESGDENKTVYGIEYDDGTKCDRVQQRYLFIPGKERTCEVWYGSLFDYPNGFDAEICILETDFPEEMHPHLIECMTTTPIGCTFLTYHDLKKFSCFDWQNLRQIDCNIYDNDRYITSWSQGWRFYIWEHIEHFTKSPNYKRIPLQSFNENDQILFRPKTEKNDDKLQYGEIITISKENFIVRTSKIESSQVHYSNQTLSSDKFDIFKSLHRFRINESVSCYAVENFKESQYHAKYQIYKGKIIAILGEKREYVIKYVERDVTRLNLSEQYIQKLPKLLYEVGENVMACWPRNAQNKNCPHRYKRFPAEIIGINNDSTYRLKYKVSPYLLSLLRPQIFPNDYEENNEKQSAYAPSAEQCYADNVREMWIQYPANFKLAQIAEIEKKLKSPFYVNYRAELVETWNKKKVCAWLKDIGLVKLVNVFEENEVSGKGLLSLKCENCESMKKELNVLLEKRKSGSSDNKSESTSIDNDVNMVEVDEQFFGLNKIEIRNLFANMKHLKQQHQLLQSQYNQSGNGQQSGGDYQKLQQVWQNFRKEMGGNGNKSNSAQYADTDTK